MPPASVMANTFEIADAVPTTVGSTPALVANSNIVNTPPSPGAITVPQSPLNTPVTNTGRTATASQAAFTLNGPQRGWNGVRFPSNPV